MFVGVGPQESLCGLQHTSGGPAKRHPCIPPAFNIAADLPDGPVHVLDDVGAGQRTAQLDRQAQAGNGEDLVEPLEDTGGDAGCVMFQPPRQVPDQPLGLVGTVQFSAWCNALRTLACKGPGETLGYVAGPCGPGNACPS